VTPFDVRVSACLLGKEAKLWIFVGTPGYEDVWWPQGKAEKIEGKWTITVNCGEEGDKGDYKICAMVVSPETDQDLNKWVESQFSDSRMEPLGELPPGYCWYKYDLINVRRVN
jgi:hypothetical protein